MKKVSKVVNVGSMNAVYKGNQKGYVPDIANGVVLQKYTSWAVIDTFF